MVFDTLSFSIQIIDNSWNYNARHITTNLGSGNKLLNDHLSNVVKHFHNLKVFSFRHPTIKTFKEVFIDVIYLCSYGWAFGLPEKFGSGISGFENFGF